MKYVNITKRLVGGNTVSEVETEADATHVAISLMKTERTAANQKIETLQRALTNEKQEKLAIIDDLQRAKTSIMKLEAAQQRTLGEKRNWRRRALSSMNVRDPECRHIYVCNRHSEWHKIITVILDCESDGDYADLAIMLASETAKELKAIVTRVWRERNIWCAEIRVPHNPCEISKNEEMQKRRDLISSGRVRVQIVPNDAPEAQ